ncbi:calcipressin [Mucor ambiguus]|uniref:Calcipressin n=1 Tax=Mucor ambiguus TaxID=91626 RepID=A0A0C9MTX0_9FUNG|nr:calcipressin [Mucor ambiguus]
MDHFRKAESIATNTLLIPDVPAIFFGCDDALLTLHDAFAEFGPIYTFVPMKGFRRLMIIFQETVHAMKAKQALDRHSIVYREREPFPEIVTYAKVDNDTEQVWKDAGNVVLQLRVYYGQHFAINVDPKSTSLQVPQFQRNLLISPPGSPFDGWEQIEEDAPNQAVLASDLMHAAEISDYELDDDELELEAIHKEKMEIKKQQKAISIVCSRGTEQPEHLPSITVQDWDGHTQLEFDGPKEEGKRKKKTVNDIVPTAMPPRKS